MNQGIARDSLIKEENKSITQVRVDMYLEALADLAKENRPEDLKVVSQNGRDKRG